MVTLGQRQNHSRRGVHPGVPESMRSPISNRRKDSVQTQTLRSRLVVQVPGLVSCGFVDRGDIIIAEDESFTVPMGDFRDGVL